MHNSNILLNKLNDIHETIKKEYINYPSVGLLSGLTGAALFQFYYAKLKDDEKHASLGMDILTNVLEKVNKNLIPPDFCAGICGIGFAIDHLYQHDFLESNCDNLFADLDLKFYEIMILEMEQGNYDFLYGSLGYALYFLKRYETTNSSYQKIVYSGYIRDFLKLLSDNAIFINKNKVLWKKKDRNSSHSFSYDLGAAHGLASVISFLGRINRHDDFGLDLKNILSGAINGLLSYKQPLKVGNSYFPNTILQTQELDLPSRLAWCYGDLGIGISLLQVSKYLKNDLLCNKAVNILEHCATRLSEAETGVIDAGFCHGAFGNAHIFKKAYHQTHIEIFKNTSDYWVNRGLKMAHHEDGFAGFKQFSRKGDYYPSISMIEGIAGIGLVLIDHVSNSNHMWDECFLMN